MLLDISYRFFVLNVNSNTFSNTLNSSLFRFWDCNDDTGIVKNLFNFLKLFVGYLTAFLFNHLLNNTFQYTVDEISVFIMLFLVCDYEFAITSNIYPLC